uniref:HECT domain-containing protein n=1 Tax=Neolamprologus brichardi TaxID=32507 RepID=A0A3Q4H5L9_NEOBR
DVFESNLSLLLQFMTGPCVSYFSSVVPCIGILYLYLRQPGPVRGKECSSPLIQQSTGKFRDGLRSLGVLDALQAYPLQMKCLFVKSESHYHFVFFYLIVENYVSLEDILVFCTGCDSIPALGFSPKPSLEFITNCRFPVSNTCENILRIPVHAVYTTFKSDMDFAIRNSPGFGRKELSTHRQKC